ncbi:hypothetical protein NQ117_06430 [Paenibacillus sp. SC116]|uniref:hypothetical protein n=1 Tax=Paenibacillus sp. SC116 TaxID=2968986 RepID=UPI00215B22F1|nr:hypothetical protein [Paenibacillus sp. SC116]MCR8843314.1 hypothetical protein [Paenibacillus sp. SC116]
MDDRNIHETQRTEDNSELIASSTTSIFEDAQRIEGIGKPQKMILSALPRPLRVFGYFFITIMVLFAVFALLSSWF